MGRRKLRKGRASEQSITRRGLRIYRMGDQIKALSGNRWDVASQGTEGAWSRLRARQTISNPARRQPPRSGPY